MTKKLLCNFLSMSLLLGCCACGGKIDKGTSSTGAPSESVSEQGSDTSSVVKEADAVLTVKIKKNEIKKFETDRPYDPNREDISIILVIGQSNSTTSVGFATEWAYYEKGKTQVVPEAPLTSAKGICYSGTTVTELKNENDIVTLADPTKGTSCMGGVSPSFGAKWHELTNTKVVFIQAAVGSVGVHHFVPDQTDYVCTCDSTRENLYRKAVACYKASYDALSKNYNVVYTGYIWNQGEHDEVYGKDPANTVSNDQAYYEAYKSMHEGLMDELKLDFGGISVVRADRGGSTAQGSRTLTIARTAQYRLCNDIDNLYMISTFSETCDHSMMDQSNTIHYSQKTFNLMGPDCAENLYYRLGLNQSKADYEGIKIYNCQGSLISEAGADGKFSKEIVLRTELTNQILVKTASLKLADEVSYTLTIPEKPKTNFIDDFGRIDWSILWGEYKVKKVELKIVTE